MTYAFILPSNVEARIFEYALFIAEDSPDHAIAWVDDISDRMKRLVKMPEAHPVSEEESEALGYEVRKLVLGYYLAFYRVDDKLRQVQMVDFRHARMQPEPNQ